MRRMMTLLVTGALLLMVAGTAMASSYGPSLPTTLSTYGPSLPQMDIDHGPLLAIWTFLGFVWWLLPVVGGGFGLYLLWRLVRAVERMSQK